MCKMIIILHKLFIDRSTLGNKEAHVDILRGVTLFRAALFQ